MKNKNQLERNLQKMGVKLAFIFGSHVSGNRGPEPDIDVAVLTSGKASLDEHEKLFRLFTEYFSAKKKEIDIVLLQDAPPALRLEAADGKLLYEYREGFAADFKEKAMKELMDFEFHRAEFEKALMEAID
jgi:uncharacterized protein